MMRRICGFRPGPHTLLTEQKFPTLLSSSSRLFDVFQDRSGGKGTVKMIDAQAEMHLRRLMQQRDQLLKEAEALKNKIAGLDLAIGVIGNGVASQHMPTMQPRIHVSETIVDLLREAGETGLKAKAAIEIAADRGVSLNRGSVYSLLNRMTRNGSVVREDARYKLKEFSRRRERASIFTAEPPHLAGKH
jgi:hypothetical protein